MAFEAPEMDRRTLLKTLGTVAAGAAFSKYGLAAAPAAGKAFKGLFPIASTPFTQDDKLDFDCLNNQVKFCNKGGVPGLIWPQIASGWTTLTSSERLAGAESMIAAGKGGKAAIVIGVQTQGKDLAGAVAYLQLPVAPLPQVDFPTISVGASLPGASPEIMASSVAAPLERQLGHIAGVSEMTSSSTLGSSSITLQFDLNRDINGAARDVQAAINAARANLPANSPRTTPSG